LVLSTFVRQPTTYLGPLLALTMTAESKGCYAFCQHSTLAV